MKHVRKALTAGGFAAVATLGALLSDGDITQAELVISLGAGLATGAATYRVPNSRA